jgi:hypothetical protein
LDLLYGLMLPSGNDAALVLSISVALLMNWRTKRLKLWEKLRTQGGVIDCDAET